MGLRFSLTIDCGNAAFEGDPGGEIARLLDHCRTDLRYGPTRPDSGVLTDSNGNRVGRWQLEEHREATS